MLYENRKNRVLELMSVNGLDGIALNPGPTLKYLTDLDFHLMERPFLFLLSNTGEAALVHPELEKGKLQDAKIPLKGYAYGENPELWDKVFASALSDLSLNKKKIGIEPTHIRYLEFQFVFLGAPDAKIIPAKNLFDELRIKKDETELENMRQAARIAQRALSETLLNIKPGITEREIALELSLQLLRAGSDPEYPFSPLVVAGPNSAKQHTAPSDRGIEPGDLLIIDWGARYKGYCSDITRTFAIGKIDPEFEKIYNIVFEANAKGKEAARPGIEAGKVDIAARKVIDDAGYGEYFFHRTGHGIGMEVHESPYIYQENTAKLEKGMTFTIEPGIYMDGKGGIRIEDDVVITTDGCESLSDYPRELQIIQ